jgi:hypothetical protein
MQTVLWRDFVLVRVDGSTAPLVHGIIKLGTIHGESDGYMSTILIEIDDETAKAYAAESEDRKRKLQLLLNLRLKEMVNAPEKSLEEVMDEIGAAAQARGLTPEILESILRDE